MTTSDGFIINTTKIVDNGPPDLRFNLVILSEGYQESEMGIYHTDVDQFIRLFFVTKPFSYLNCTFNIYRVDVASTDSGIADPCDGTGTKSATYFDASFCYQGISRDIGINEKTVLSVAKSQVPNYHRVLVYVNSHKEGGSSLIHHAKPSRDDIAIISNAANYPAEGMIHELGHTIGGLTDEYPYLNSCDVGEDPVTRNIYTGIEPLFPNITTVTDRNQIKWSSLISSTTPMPTMRNLDCTKCDEDASPVPIGTVGAFEGGSEFHCGLFRPEYDCKMRTLGVPFCQVCEQSILKEIIPRSRSGSCVTRFPHDKMIARVVVEGPVFVHPGDPPASIPVRFSWITKITSTRLLDLGSINAKLFLLTKTGEIPLYSVKITSEEYGTSGEYHSKTYSFELPTNQALAIYKSPYRWKTLRLVLQGNGIDGGPYYDDVPLFVTDQF
ncbi:M64 family metallopeptidase [Bacillus thuringiensis]|uniref:M64 family metallopeptidase n=1 Tax=Bacillus thuringiensis TaxID=1428 RepID=UPI0021E88792|nr:M64 family metallopeptidase [Bacillus thuringiensis]